MTEVFGPTYARAYDAFYGDKDYGAECDLVERLLKQYAPGPVRTVLDLGCGTGNHAVLLAERGYDVTGVDVSESMLEQARKKAATTPEGGKAVFRHGDIRDVDLRQSFDAGLLMFAVLGYQLDNEDVLATLRNVRRHLRPGAPLVFDVWYGPGVLSETPSQRVKVIPTEGGRILRVASGELDPRRHLCTVQYQVWRVEGDRIVDEAQERHTVRFFFPRELELMLEVAGFDLARLGAFPDIDCEPDATTWNACCVAIARGEA